MPKYHAWTGKVQPFTVSDKDIHAEIAEGQVVRWTPEQIKAAEKAKYFDKLTERCQHNTRLLLISELCGDEEIE